MELSEIDCSLSFESDWLSFDESPLTIELPAAVLEQIEVFSVDKSSLSLLHNDADGRLEGRRRRNVVGVETGVSKPQDKEGRFIFALNGSLRVN